MEPSCQQKKDMYQRDKEFKEVGLTSKIRTKVGIGTLKLDLGPQNNLIKKKKKTGTTTTHC